MNPLAAASLLGLAYLAPIDSSQIESELMRAGEIMPSQLELSDQYYVIPDQTWIETAFIPYLQSYFEATGLKAEGEGMDCDNFAQLFKQQLALCNARGGRASEGDVPGAVIKAQQFNDFGGVAGDGSWHSLILLRTSAGWQVIEPQTGVMAPLERYPNRAYIDWALF